MSENKSTMRRFRYSVSTSVLWASFDSGEVEAANRDEAKAKAIKQLKYDFKKVNDLLAFSDNTIGWVIDFNRDCVEIEEIMPEK